MQTVAITGGCGFVGRYLTKRLLEDNLNVRLFDTILPGKETFPLGLVGLKDYSFTKLDINNTDLLEKNLEGVDAIVHLAGMSSRYSCLGNSYGAFLSNVHTSASLIESARRCEVKNIVFASSTRVSNNNILLEKDPYTISKYIAELWLQTVSQISDVNVNIIRFSNIYGLGQGEGTVIQDFIIRAMRGEYPVKYEGEVRMQFLYIDDAVDAIYHILKNSDSSNAYAVKGMDSVSLYELAELIINEAVKSGILFDERELAKKKGIGITDNASNNKSKAAGFNGWVPKIGIKEGISRTWKYNIGLSE